MSRARRPFLLGGAALVAAVGFAIGAWLISVAGSEPEPDAEVSGEIRGLRAELIDRELPAPAGGFAWTAVWRLCWTPTPGARTYLVTIITSEGVDPRPRTTTKPCFSLDVATGTASKRGVRPGLDGQVAVMESMLSVSVAARLRDGSIGPAAPDLPVGREFP